MTTTTLPADVETERLAKKVAAATGKPIATIVRDALAAHALGLGISPSATDRERTRGQIRSALEEAAAKLRDMPVLDPRTAEEIIGYDEHGVPR
jgi:antitoxin VapB